MKICKLKIWLGSNPAESNISFVCADPGNFVRGVQVSLTKKALTRFFFFFFLVLSLFLRKSNGQFQRNLLSFFKVSEIFQGGPAFSSCLFPIETHITCDFPGGGPDPLSPPLDPHLLRIPGVTSFNLVYVQNQFSWL